MKYKILWKVLYFVIWTDNAPKKTWKYIIMKFCLQFEVNVGKLIKYNLRTPKTKRESKKFWPQNNRN